MLFAPPWLDEFFSIIQSAWSTSVTADELSECHKKSFERQVKDFQGAFKNIKQAVFSVSRRSVSVNIN